MPPSAPICGHANPGASKEDSCAEACIVGATGAVRRDYAYQFRSGIPIYRRLRKALVILEGISESRVQTGRGKRKGP
jgi:hypothetical protein